MKLSRTLPALKTVGCIGNMGHRTKTWSGGKSTPTPVTLNCVQCGNPFQLTEGKQTICSDECRRERENARGRKPKVKFTCLVCSNEFMSYNSSTGPTAQKLCSVRCRRIHRTRTLDWRNRRNGLPKGGIRRLRKNSKPCTVCGFSRAVQLCHIIPVKDGGTSTHDNLAWMCPNHHFLFDHNRMTEEEKSLICTIDGKFPYSKVEFNETA